MPTLAVNNFNIVVSVLGGWVSLFGLVSYLCKENFYLSEAREYIPVIPRAQSWTCIAVGLLDTHHRITEKCFALG